MKSRTVRKTPWSCGRLVSKILLTAVAVIVGISSAVAATAAKWAWPTAATTFENAADWDASANWVGSAKPAAKGDSATFTTTDTLVNWIRIPATGTGLFSTLTANSGNGTSYFFGGPISMVGPSSGNPTINAAKSVFYTDIGCNAQVTCNGGTTVHGKMNTDFLIGSSKACTFIWDWSRFSESSASGLREYSHDKTCRPNYGSLSIVFPRGMEAADGVWKTTKDSRYVLYVSGPKGTEIAAGAPVTSPLFPEGTFVRRTFGNVAMELSNVAADTSETADIHFERCTSRFHMKLTGAKSFYKGSTSDSSLSLTTVGEATGNDNRLYLKPMPQNGTSTGYVLLTGTASLANTNSQPRVMLEYSPDWETKNCQFHIANGLVELQPTNGTSRAYYGGQMGLVGRNGGSTPSRMHFDVPTGRFATVNRISRVGKWNNNYIDPYVYKWGGGDLELKMAANAINATFNVNDGMLGMEFRTATAAISSMTIAANKGFRINTGTNLVTMAKLTLNNGVTLGNVVNEDGVVSCATVTTADFSKGGNILVSGNLKKLKGGDYPLWKQSAITAATAAKWTLQFSDPDHADAMTSLAGRSKLVSTAGVLSLHVDKLGLVLVVQ